MDPTYPDDRSFVVGRLVAFETECVFLYFSTPSCNHFVCLTNLRELKVSNLVLEQLRHGHAYFEDTILQYCPKLEVSEWTNTTTERGYLIHANGRSLTPMPHLKKMYFDDCFVFAVIITATILSG